MYIFLFEEERENDRMCWYKPGVDESPPHRIFGNKTSSIDSRVFVASVNLKTSSSDDVC